jgi:uroporphyrinogen decarboxylase
MSDARMTEPQTRVALDPGRDKTVRSDPRCLRLTPRERFIHALERKPPLPGRVPHFELVFFLTMEAFGRVHPSQRYYGQWQQMSEGERGLHRRDIGDLYVACARRYEHSAIFFHPPGGWASDDDTLRTLDHIREISGQDFFLVQHGDATYSVPGGSEMMAFVERIADEPDKVREEAARNVDRALERATRFRKHGALDGLALCADYCFNSGPFLSPAMFDDFITPYLIRLVAGYRELGFYVIKHTDGNIMPILQSLLDARPHALHSLDPQGGVDIAKVKKIAGERVCLIGNVNCGLLDTGTDEQVVASTRYALQNGMPGGGYIFSTSNCIYTGMPLKRYELMLDVWRREGKYT